MCWPLKLYNQYNLGELEKQFDKFKELQLTSTTFTPRKLNYQNVNDVNDALTGGIFGVENDEFMNEVFRDENDDENDDLMGGISGGENDENDEYMNEIMIMLSADAAQTSSSSSSSVNISNSSNTQRESHILPLHIHTAALNLMKYYKSIQPSINMVIDKELLSQLLKDIEAVRAARAHRAFWRNFDESRDELTMLEPEEEVWHSENFKIKKRADLVVEEAEKVVKDAAKAAREQAREQAKAAEKVVKEAEKHARNQFEQCQDEQADVWDFSRVQDFLKFIAEDIGFDFDLFTEEFTDKLVSWSEQYDLEIGQKPSSIDLTCITHSYNTSNKVPATRSSRYSLYLDKRRDYKKCVRPTASKVLLQQVSPPNIPVHVGTALKDKLLHQWTNCIFDTYDKMHTTGTLSCPFPTSYINK